jgi:hypothetical protein
MYSFIGRSDDLVVSMDKQITEIGILPVWCCLEGVRLLLLFDSVRHIGRSVFSYVQCLYNISCFVPIYWLTSMLTSFTFILWSFVLKYYDYVAIL